MTDFSTSDLYSSSKLQPVHPHTCCTSSHGGFPSILTCTKSQGSTHLSPSNQFLPILSRVLLGALLDSFSHILHIHILSSSVDSTCKYPLILLSLFLSLCMSVCVTSCLPPSPFQTTILKPCMAGDEYLSSQPLESRSRRTIAGLSLVYTVNPKSVVQSDSKRQKQN